MSRFWSSVVAGLDPYIPGEQPRIDNLVKLNTNEHPFGPSPKVIQAIKEATNDSLRLYPDPSATVLREAIAKRFSLEAAQVFVGNGSDEVLAHAFQALLKQDAPLVFPDITYSFYPVYCGLYDIEFRTIPLDDDLCMRTSDFLPPAIGDVGGIIFPNPNAPTGRSHALSDIERIIASHPNIVVVIDEAYVDFGAESAVALIDKYPNLLVVHTLSKSASLAGLRVGYAVGHRELIEGLDRVKNSFNSYPLDRLALAGATAAIEDNEYLVQSCTAVVKTRERMSRGLKDLGFTVLPSSANFVFAKHSKMSGLDLAVALRQRNILVRHFNKPRLTDYLRITVGTNDQTELLLRNLVEILR
jgi:histidinol-phosphate aminotransferase